MKISLITMQGVYNYGSALQTYATISTLKKLGYDIEVVNYFPNRMRNYGSLKQIYRDALPFHSKWKCILISLVKYPSMVSLKKIFLPFQRKYFNLTKRYETNEELIANPPEADVYCTGSDQVWNDYLEGEFDKAYFLDFAPSDAKRISIAASFGRDNITPDQLEPVSDFLRRYSAITVRENSGLEILKHIDVPTKECVLDPTFLLLLDEWNKLSEPIHEQNYILVYQLHEDSIASEAAIAIGQRLNKKVIRISTDRLKRIKSGKTILFPKVEEFISYIRDADLVVTDSFHATAFSLITKTDFVSISWKMFNDRIGTILRKVGLENRCAHTVEEAIDITNNKIEYTVVQDILSRERVRTINFIREALQPEE